MRKKLLLEISFDEIIALDNYAGSLFLQCPCKYNYRINKQLVPTETTGGKAFGAAIHKAADVIAAGGAADKAYDAFLMDYGPRFLAELKDDWRTPELGRTVIEAYANQRPVWDEIVTFDDGTPGVEVPFYLLLDGDEGIIYCGRIDKVVRWRDKIMPVDHKTTSRLSKNVLQSYTPNNQMSGYIWAVMQLVPEAARSMSMIIDLIHVTKSKEPHFVPLIIDRSPAMLEEWKQNVRAAALGIRINKKLGYWEQNTAACKEYNGCDYLKICGTSPGAERDRVVKNFYTIKPWSPQQMKEESKE